MKLDSEIMNEINNFEKQYGLRTIFTPVDVNVANASLFMKYKFLFLDTSKGKHSLTLTIEHGENITSDIKFALRIKVIKGGKRLVSLEEINSTLNTSFMYKSGDLLYEGSFKRDEMSVDKLSSIFALLNEPLIKDLKIGNDSNIN